MTIQLFHGSYSDFSEFKIDESLVKTTKNNLAEGLGIYFATNKEFTESYGDILYTVSIEDGSFLDFTKDETFTLLFNKIEGTLGFDLADYINVEEFIRSVKAGSISIHKLNSEIEQLLESNPSFYFKFEEKITYEEDCLFTELESVFQEFLTPVFAYYDSSFKQKIFICVKNPETLKIVSKEKRA